MLLLVAMSIGRTALANYQAYLHGELFRSSFMQRLGRFGRCLAQSVATSYLLSWLDGHYGHRLTLLKLAWREDLTSMLHTRYFRDMAYYKLANVDRAVSHPEQRICEDVPKFCHGFVDVVGNCIPAAVDSAFYSVRLYQLARSNKYSLGMVAYIMSAGTLMAVTSPNFGRLFRRTQELEGAYRGLQSRLQANSESVALYGGIAVEGDGIRSSFRTLQHHLEDVLLRQWRFGMLSDFALKYLGATASVYMIVGPFFDGHLRPGGSFEGRAAMLSQMRYHASVIISLFSSLGVLGGVDQQLKKLGAYASRINELKVACESVGSGRRGGTLHLEDGSMGAGKEAGGVVEDSEEISFEDVTVMTPADTKLIEGLTLTVKPGMKLLVTGPNGAGKSSLFRVLGGLWPFTKGRVSKPGGSSAGLASDIYYVPQRPYVSIGTLMEQLVYPCSPDGPDGETLELPELRALLKTVDLVHLFELYGTEDVVNWGDVLSLGEQQRLGMARLFYHRPRFAILDECTSGVTTDMEQRFCDIVQAMGCTCITISHRPALAAFHDVVLHLDGEGGWTLKDLSKIKQDTAPPVLTPQSTASSQRGVDSDIVLHGMVQSKITKRTASYEDLHLGAIVAKNPEHVRISHVPGEELRSSSHMASRKRTAEQRKREWRLIRHFIPQGREVFQVAALAATVLMRTALSDRIANLNGTSVQLALAQDRAGFVALLKTSVAQSAASAIVAPSLRYLTNILAVTWRARLTKVLCRDYLTSSSFYNVIHRKGMGDADQRITRDVERLCDDTAALVPSMVKPIVDVLWFSLRCYQLTGLKGTAVVYAYTLLGYSTLRALTPNLGKFSSEEFEREGAFRHSHTRLGACSESVAFFGGGDREGSLIGNRFHALCEHIAASSRARLRYDIFDNFLTVHLPHCATWVATLIFAMEYPGDYSGLADVQGNMVRDMRYLATVVYNNFTAYGDILGLYKRFVELRGGFTRVCDMMDAAHCARLEAERPSYTEDAAVGPTRLLTDYIPEGDEPLIRFQGATIVTPKDKTLAEQLNLTVALRRNLLVTGPNGSGKSSIFRVLAGLWPLPEGRISVCGHGAGLSPDVFHVPQKPYTAIGTLREQIFYPQRVEEALAVHGCSSAGEMDASLQELMRAVKLEYLVERWGWDAATEWGERLSLGEQQRLGMARLFFHCPKFAVLDECTNATSVDIEEALYRHANKLGITLITISQRPALVKYHAQELRLIDGEGAWTLHNIKKEGRGGGAAHRREFFLSDTDSD